MIFHFLESLRRGVATRTGGSNWASGIVDMTPLNHITSPRRVCFQETHSEPNFYRGKGLGEYFPQVRRGLGNTFPRSDAQICRAKRDARSASGTKWSEIWRRRRDS